MTPISTLTLTGKSGRQYEFKCYPIGTEFRPVAAVYAVTKRKTDRTHTVIYVGQTSNLPERFDDHHKAACFSGHGANCICIHRDNNESSRQEKEADLIAAYNPPCNG